MVEIKPFCGLRYNDSLDPALVTAPPYDVIDRHFHEVLYDRHPANVVRMDLGKTEMGDTTENNAFTRAAGLLKRWQDDSTLRVETKPCVYAYSQTWKEPDGIEITRKGFVALLKIEDYAAKKILPHEQTLKGPIADRLMLMKATLSNLSQIFMIYGDPNGTMENLLFDETGGDSWVSATDDNSTEHHMRAVSDPAVITQLQQLFADKSVLIADGHHRYETALAFKKEVRERLKARGETPPPEGALASDYLMVFFANFHDPGLQVLPTDRVLYQWPEGWSPERFEAALIEQFAPAEPGAAMFSVTIPGRWDVPVPLKLKDPGQLKHLPLLLRSFDTAVLEEMVFKKILGQDSQQAMKTQHLLGFYRDPAYVKKLVENKEAVAVFYMGVPSVALVKAICEAGYLMPQKSTYFYPKILTGLVFNSFTQNGTPGITPLKPGLFGSADLDPDCAIVPE